MGIHFKTMYIWYFSSNFHPLILSPIDDSCLNQLLLWLPGGNFFPQFHHSFYIYQLGFQAKELHCSLFVISMTSQISILFNGLQSIVILYFDVQIVPDLASGSWSALSQFPCLFDRIQSFFNTSLLCGTKIKPTDFYH